MVGRSVGGSVGRFRNNNNNNSSSSNNNNNSSSKNSNDSSVRACVCQANAQRVHFKEAVDFSISYTDVSPMYGRSRKFEVRRTALCLSLIHI